MSETGFTEAPLGPSLSPHVAHVAQTAVTVSRGGGRRVSCDDATFAVSLLSEESELALADPAAVFVCFCVPVNNPASASRFHANPSPVLSKAKDLSWDAVDDGHAPEKREEET